MRFSSKTFRRGRSRSRTRTLRSRSRTRTLRSRTLRSRIKQCGGACSIPYTCGLQGVKTDSIPLEEPKV